MIFARRLSTSTTLRRTAVTFFTKETCQLCTNAKGVLQIALESKEINKPEIDLQVVDIMDPANQKWFDVYCYDVPVLHIQRDTEPKPAKFMHYFDAEKIVNALK